MTDAQRALLEWVDEHYTGIHQALEHMAVTNEEDAKKIRAEAEHPNSPENRTHLLYIAKTLDESAASWRATVTQLTKLYQALPTEE